MPLILALTTGCGQSNFSASDEQEAQAQLSDVPPVIAASALQAEAQETLTRDFYENVGWAAIWSPRAQAAFSATLEERAIHGLDRVQFLPPELSELSAAGREIALTRAALHYAGALAHGIADPAKLHSTYTIPDSDVDVAPGLITALRAGRVPAWLNSLAPGTPEYGTLAATYLQQRKAAAQEDTGQEDGTEIASGALVRPGGKDPRIPQVVIALLENRYLTRPAMREMPVSQDAEDELYNADIVAAVKRLQQDYGISDDGVIGDDTLAILNVRPADRARSIAVAMERLRWLTRDPPATRIDVNTAAAELSYFRDGKLIDQRNVVVGKPGNETPQISTSMFQLVANPTWTVPRSIQEGGLAGRSPAYFRRNNMSWRDGWIVQGSGPRNSLGLVKFDLQNDLAIYLHDTPAKALLDKNQRQLSHGCVRVADALGFAQMLAEQQDIADQWSKARASGKMTYLKLPEAIPVRLIYSTVYVSETNQVSYRTDPYGWNVLVAETLGFGRDASRQFRGGAGDIGP